MERIAGLERFWEKVSKTNTCWLWQGAKTHNGYGQLTLKNTRHRAHRFIFQVFYGPVETGQVVDHICRVRNCVNPSHLRSITPQQNSNAPGNQVGAHMRRKTHCPQKHEYTQENTYYKPSSRSRHCRECRRNTKGAST